MIEWRKDEEKCLGSDSYKGSQREGKRAPGYPPGTRHVTMKSRPDICLNHQHSSRSIQHADNNFIQQEVHSGKFICSRWLDRRFARACSKMSRPRGDMLSTSELDQLQRKYRSMELARRDLHDDNSNTLRMQRAQIEKLKKDHERIKEELALETRQAKLSNNMSATHSIAKLQDQGDIYQRKIEIEKRKIAELSQSMKKMEQCILNSRKESGGVNAARDINLSANKSIRILENRLDKALVKFNEALAHNKQLRETIDNLRRERVVFDGIYRKLERELGEKKEKMAAIIDVSHAAYEARGQAQGEMFALKSNADEQQDRFEHEWDALGELIAKDAEMKSMLAQKEQERSFALTHGILSAVSVDSKSDSFNQSSLAVLDPSADEESRLKLKVKRAKSMIRKDRESILANQSRVLQYEESFAKIQAATSIADIEELVGVFVAAEDENFKLFNFVNSLNQEIERQEDSIEALNASVKVYAKQEDQTQSSDSQRKVILTTLESQVNSTQQATLEFDNQSGLMQQTLGSLKSSIEKLAATLGCSAEQQTELFGSSGVTELNLNDYLGLIESKANVLIQSYSDYQHQAVKQQALMLSSNANEEAVSDNDDDDAAEAQAAAQEQDKQVETENNLEEQQDNQPEPSADSSEELGAAESSNDPAAQQPAEIAAVE